MKFNKKFSNYFTIWCNGLFLAWVYDHLLGLIQKTVQSQRAAYITVAWPWLSFLVHLLPGCRSPWNDSLVKSGSGRVGRIKLLSVGKEPKSLFSGFPQLLCNGEKKVNLLKVRQDRKRQNVSTVTCLLVFWSPEQLSHFFYTTSEMCSIWKSGYLIELWNCNPAVISACSHP